MYKENVGSMIDKLSILNLKIWHHEDVAHNKESTDKEVADAKRAINSLNKQRTDMVEAIDNLFHESITEGKPLPPKADQFKNYAEGQTKSGE